MYNKSPQLSKSHRLSVCTANGIFITQCLCTNADSEGNTLCNCIWHMLNSLQKMPYYGIIKQPIAFLWRDETTLVTLPSSKCRALMHSFMIQQALLSPIKARILLFAFKEYSIFILRSSAYLCVCVCAHIYISITFFLNIYIKNLKKSKQTKNTPHQVLNLIDSFLPCPNDFASNSWGLLMTRCGQVILL